MVGKEALLQLTSGNDTLEKATLLVLEMADVALELDSRKTDREVDVAYEKIRNLGEKVEQCHANLSHGKDVIPPE